MADTKRQNTGGKLPVATPNVGPSSMLSLEHALSGAIGARIRITTTGPNKPVLEGTLFTTCPLTNLVAISTTPSSTFRILPISTIQNFTLISAPTSSNGPAPFTNTLPPLAPLNTAALSTRADAAVARLKEAEARKGKGVGKEAQEIFDALAKSLPARWDATNMVINDAVVIVAPYRAEDCKVGQGQPKEMLARVKKILDAERKKLADRTNKPVVPAVPAIPTQGLRKGG